MNKLPIFEYSTLEEVCDFIGCGCTKANLWRWREAGVIDICVFFDMFDAYCKVVVTEGGQLDEIMIKGDAFTIGLSELTHIETNTREVFCFSEPHSAIFNARCHGVWKLTDSNKLIFFHDHSPLLLNLTFELNGNKPKINGDIPLNEGLSIELEKANNYKFVICSESINRITENIGKSLPIQAVVSNHSFKTESSTSEHKKRHAAEREHILACAIHALHHFPQECGSSIESWFNCINNHNNIYQLEEKDGVISSYVRRILADARKNTPETWKIIGGKK